MQASASTCGLIVDGGVCTDIIICISSPVSSIAETFLPCTVDRRDIPGAAPASGLWPERIIVLSSDLHSHRRHGCQADHSQPPEAANPSNSVPRVAACIERLGAPAECGRVPMDDTPSWRHSRLRSFLPCQSMAECFAAFDDRA